MPGENLVWVDMEFSGLDPKRDVVLEIATVVTDGELNILAQGPVIAINQSDEVLAGMDDWNQRVHNSSGLVQRVKESTYTHESAEKETLDFLAGYCSQGKSPLCGNTVYMDRVFMKEHMPVLDIFLHYRIIDVSSIKELVQRWYPDTEEFVKKASHIALEDILESIAELAHYRTHIFR